MWEGEKGVGGYTILHYTTTTLHYPYTTLEPRMRATARSHAHSPTPPRTPHLLGLGGFSGFFKHGADSLCARRVLHLVLFELLLYLFLVCVWGVRVRARGRL